VTTLNAVSSDLTTVNCIDLIESEKSKSSVKPNIIVSEIDNESLEKDFHSNSQTGLYDQTEIYMSSSKMLSKIHSASTE